MKRQPALALSIIVLSTFIGGCAPKYSNLIRQKGEGIGWTKEQQAVAEHLSYRLKFTKENPDGGFEINYSVLSNQLVANIACQRVKDLEEVLDYKNFDWASYIKAFNLRDELEREEKIFKAVCSRLRLVDHFNKFKVYMGERSSYRPMELDLGYDAAKVFAEDVFGAYPFSSDRIENARKDGKLKEVERLLWSAKRTFGRKELDPSDPDDPNKFIWRAEEVGIEFISYKILNDPNPKDKSLDYVEGTRFTMTSGGAIHRESKPALKLFVSDGKQSAVLLVDRDKEGEVGYMLPDLVEIYPSINTAENLLHDSVLSNLFPVTEKEKRIKPKDPPPIVVEIAPVGKKIDVWEQSSNGWAVPFKYKNDRADNFGIAIKIKGDENAHFDPTTNKQIEYLKKNWHGIGNVIEYFRLKPPYDSSNLISVSIGDNRIALVTSQGEEIIGYITPGTNRVIQDKPYQIEYTESEKGWLIADDDGDGKYEKKRQIAR